MARPVRRSLAAAFQPQPAQAPPDRAADLSGLLPPRPEQTTDPAPGLSLVEPATNQPVAAAFALDDAPVGGTRTAPGPATHSGPSARTADDVVRGVVVYVPVEVLERLRATARSRQLTYADLLVESTVHLPDVEQQLRHQGRAVQPAPGAMPGRAVRRATPPGVQVQLRLDGHQVRWLDEQVQRVGAPSRSALVVALLDHHLASTSPRSEADTSA